MDDSVVNVMLEQFPDSEMKDRMKEMMTIYKQIDDDSSLTDTEKEAKKYKYFLSDLQNIKDGYSELKTINDDPFHVVFDLEEGDEPDMLISDKINYLTFVSLDGTTIVYDLKNKRSLDDMSLIHKKQSHILFSDQYGEEVSFKIDREGKTEYMKFLFGEKAISSN